MKRCEYWRISGNDIHIYYDDLKKEFIFDINNVVFSSKQDLELLYLVIEWYLKYCYPDYMEICKGINTSLENVKRSKFSFSKDFLHSNLNVSFENASEYFIKYTLPRIQKRRKQFLAASGESVKVVYSFIHGKKKYCQNLVIYNIDKLKYLNLKLLQNNIREHPNGIIVNEHNRYMYEPDKVEDMRRRLSYQQLKKVKFMNRFMELLTLSQEGLLLYIQNYLRSYSYEEVCKLIFKNRHFLDLRNQGSFQDYFSHFDPFVFLSREELVMFLLKQSEIDLSYFESYKDVKVMYKQIRRI